MKRIIKLFGALFLLFFVTVLAVNLWMPAIHKRLSEADKTDIAQTSFRAEQPGTDRIVCIDDNTQALLWRLRLIGSAQESVILTTFDLRADEGGTDILSALYCAAQRGVKVQILTDGIYQFLYLKDSEVFRALCEHENVEARFYNPISLKNIYKVNYRMHDKYIIADNRAYMLGGRNTNNIFLGNYQEGINEDRDILVYETAPEQGDSLDVLQIYFRDIWELSQEPKYRGKLSDDRKEELYRLLKSRYAALEAGYECFERYENWMEDTYAVNKITLITNGMEVGRKAPEILYTIERLTEQAEDVFIQTPYAICSKEMYEVLRNMEHNAEVRIMLNAVERGSNPWGCTDYLNQKKRILETGADVYELMNEHAVHTKTILVDDDLSVVGSYNLDMRSTYLDTELMLVIDSEELNAHIRSMLQEYMKKSTEVLSDGNVTRGQNYQEKMLSGKKKIFYQVLRVIIRPFRHLL